MTRTILRAVIGGIFVGALAFFVPKLLIGLIILCVVIHAFHCCGGHHRCGGHRFGSKQMFYLADKIRKMSNEEFEEFKTTFGSDCCQDGYHHHSHCCGGSESSNDDCCKSDKSTNQSN